MKMRGDQIQERFKSGLKLFSILIMCAITGSSRAQWQITQAKKQSKGFDYYGLRVAMSIRSIDGKVLIQLITPFGGNKIDVDSLPNGIYYCLIETNTGILNIAKFIVSND